MTVERVILVFKSHFDIGFTGLAKDVLSAYSGDVLASVASVCEQTAARGALKYVWTVPAWPLTVMEEQCAPERLPALQGLIARDQLCWHALPYTSHYDFCDMADAIWGLGYARSLSERYGKPVSVAGKLTDVPGAGWMLPEVLSAAGIKFLHIGCNEFAMPPDVPPLFWWEAQSGARVLVMYSKGGYGTGLTPPKGWQYPVWLALMSAKRDNGGPQTVAEIEALQEEARRAFPGASVESGTLDDFYKALNACDLRALPVVRKDLADTWIHGVGSYPMEAGLIRRLRARVRRAEIALAQTPNDAARTAIASARDAMALFCEHTWGLDVKTFLGAIPDYRRAAFDAFRKSEACLRMEESWREQSARALRAKAYCEQAEKALGIPVETERPRECGAPCADTALENDAYRLEFDPTTGVVLSLYDKRRGCALLSARGRRSAIEYVYQRYGMADINEYLRAYAYHFTDWGVLDNGRERYPDCERLTRLPAFEGCERAGDTVIFSYRGAPDDDLGDARRIELSLSLAQGDAPLCVRARLLGKRATPYVESAELCFSLPEQPTRYLLNKPGCVVDPARDIAPCANHAFYALERFAACDGARALTVVETEDCALMSIGESGVYQFRREYAPSEPVLRFCLLNNMWGTNFPQWIAGDFAFDFRVSARDAGDIDGAMRASAPKVTLPFALPSDWEVVHIAPARGGLTVCLHALSARPTRGELRFPGYRLRLTDLAGRALGAWQTEALAISAGAYGLCAVRAERLSAAGSVTL